MKIEVLEQSKFKAKTAELAMAQELNDRAEQIVLLAEEALQKNANIKVSIGGLIDGDELQIAMLRIQDIKTIADGFIRYCQGRYLDIEEKEKEFRSQIDELNKELGSLTERLKIVNEVNKDLKRENEELRKENESLKEQLSKAKEFDTNRVNNLLDLFESNVKSIALGVKMKKTQEERNEMIKTSDLVIDYQEGGMNLEEIGKKWGLTGNAVKYRLTNAGVYTGKNSNYKK